MLEWIKDGNNFLIVITICLFLLFALIGYLVDNLKNKKNKESELLTEVDLPHSGEKSVEENVSVLEPQTNEMPKEEIIPNTEPEMGIPEVNLEEPKDNNK